MLIRRLYSSCSRAAPPTELAKPHTSTRGRLRLKPSRVTPSQTLSKLTRPRSNINIAAAAVSEETLKSLSLSNAGRGRKGKARGRRTQSSSSTMGMTTAGPERTLNVPFIAGHPIEGFTPVHLYPVQAALHLSFTPPHMPIPANLGARMYTTAPTSDKSSSFNVESLFKAPPRPSPVPELSRSSDNVLGDHQSVLSALSHPVNIHHLGSMSNSLPPSLRTEGEGDTVLARMMAEAGVKWRLSPEAEWEKTLARLSRSHAHAEAATRTDIQSQDELKASASKNEASVNDAVNGLEALLDKLDLGHQVDMTSVKRKRKQKISKHKYKKRRKVSSRYNMGGGG